MLNQALTELSEVTEQIALLQVRKRELEDLIKEETTHEFETQLANTDYGTGTVSIETDEYVVKAVVPKTVKWDQEKLMKLWGKLKSDGKNPAEYIKYKFDVSEAAYKLWPSDISLDFADARTVSKGKVRYDIKRKEV